ncbi:DUF814-domain-containing protein [Nadsonia fulvescens var. elongata DSM 6958]|uniref:DUF814-domain-containing protein n=1 Tax=Nadsonia fulvescens var. elongata DSM 6958 TaxID=857566 RepID=A0A1E3PGJ5_9ASCO|nr:DUF814-domain-containing protein [Nadsonia fulvescens var. elongata DSM 6958]
MVYYFKSTALPEYGENGVSLYMGKNKEENEDLIKHAYPVDIWFHVDNLSSAHVYLRLPSGLNWENIPEALLEDIGQLTKANSIEGNKKDNVTIIYTPASNLKKNKGMATGQVGFKKDGNKMVKKVFIAKKVNAIMNRLNKTKKEAFPDLRQERLDWEREEAAIQKKASLSLNATLEHQARETYNANYQKQHAYDDLFTEDNLRHTSNQFRDENWEDDFM